MNDKIVKPTHPKFKDLTGKQIGRWRVIEFVGRDNSGNLFWKCECDCGAMKRVAGAGLANGTTTSCGCFRTENRPNLKKTHGLSKIKEYKIWKGMKQRCNNNRSPSYFNYGGRGIKICDRWQNSFDNFLADMGHIPSTNHTLDRIDNDGNYEPSNCRWATVAEQSRNRRSTMMLTFNGITQCAKDWSKIVGVKASTIRERIHRGWTVDEALSGFDISKAMVTKE